MIIKSDNLIKLRSGAIFLCRQQSQYAAIATIKPTPNPSNCGLAGGAAASIEIKSRMSKKCIVPCLYFWSVGCRSIKISSQLYVRTKIQVDTTCMVLGCNRKSYLGTTNYPLLHSIMSAAIHRLRHRLNPDLNPDLFVDLQRQLWGRTPCI